MKKGQSLFILLVLITLAAVTFLDFYSRGSGILNRSPNHVADRDLKTQRSTYSDSDVATSKLPKKNQMLNIDQSPRYNESNSTLEPSKSKQLILKKNYMFSFWYAEQLTMSTAHLIQLLNLAVGWNFTGVVPYVLKSELFGVRLQDKPSQEYVKFSLLFNVSNLNYELANCHNRASDSDVFEPMSQFLKHSYRDITTVYFSRQAVAPFSWSINNAMDGGVKFGKEPIVDCTATARERDLSRRAEDRLNKELQSWSDNKYDTTKQPFRVVQSFCVDKTLPLTLAQMMDHIDRHIKQRVGPNGIRERLTSVVFVSWQGRFTRKFEDIDTMNKCSLPHGYTKIGHSNTVKQTALQFVESLGLQNISFLSIHVRFEKLFEHAPKTSERYYFQCVVKKLNRLIDEVRHTHNLSPTAAVVMTDYGTYGSESCAHKGWSKATCLEEANKLQSSVVVPKTEFDPTKFKLPRNSGFVSLVESESILLGKALITVGRGSYQDSIVKRFLHTRESNCVYRIGGANDDCEKS